MFDRLSPRWQCWLPYIILTLAVFVAYSNVYNNAFVFDDGLLITLNNYLRSWDTFGNLFTASTTEGAHISGGFYRPVQNILYFFIYQFFGLSTVAFHFLNIALHAANACLIFTLGRKLKFNHAATLCAALLWAIHPIHTEAVAYMSSTADMLFVMFMLWALIILLPDFSLRKIISIIPLFLLALLSKESAVVFPALAVVTYYFVSEERLKPKTYLKTWPLWLIAIAYTVWRMSAPGFDGPQTYAHIFLSPEYNNLKIYSENFSLRLYTFFATIPNYLLLLIWPSDLHMERSFPIYLNMHPIAIGGLIALLAALAQIIFVRSRRGLPLSWGLLWFGAAHFPNTGLLVVGNALFLEHWMYLPSIGLFMGIAQSLYLTLGDVRAQKLKPYITGAVSVTALALTFATLLQNAVWQSPITFYNNIFKYNEITARGHNNLAMAYTDMGDFPKAIEEYKKAIATSDTYAETHHNLAVALLSAPNRNENIPEAVSELHKALAIDPGFYRSYIALAQVAIYQNDKAKAQEYTEKANRILAGGQP